MANAILRTVVVLSACALFSQAAACHKRDMPELSVEEVSKMMGQPNVFIVDANNPDQYQKAHLPGAKYIPYDAVKAELLPRDKETTLIFYCKNTH